MNTILGKIRSSKKSLLMSAAAFLVSLLLSALIMLACGFNPLDAYAAILSGSLGSLRGVINTFVQATPLIFTGLAYSFAKKASLINLGVEGQMYMGALGAAIVGTADLGLPLALHLPLAILASFVFGAAYGGIIGVMKVKFGSNEVVAGVMLNTIATCIVGYLLNGPMLAQNSSTTQSERVLETAQLPRLLSQYQLSIAIFIAVAACIFIYWFISRTTFGYELRGVGLNLKAAETAGISVGKVMIIAMCVSGGIAGLAGANQVLGVDRRLINNFSPGYGFNGIAVAALAADNPLGVIVAGTVFGLLTTGATELNRITSVPVEFVDVIQAMVVIFVTAPLLIRDIFHIRSKKKNGRMPGRKEV